MQTRIILFVLIVLEILLASPVNAVAGKLDDGRIVVLLSHGIQPYQEVMNGFREHLLRNGKEMDYEVHSLEGDVAKVNCLIQEIGKGGARMLLTLGSVATQAACKARTPVPMIAGMILNANDLKGTDNATGVTLEYPLETQFQWMRRFLPESRDVGVIYNPRENGERVEAAARVAGQMGLRLYAVKIELPRELPSALESLANKANILWGLADGIVLTPQTAEQILLFSFRNRIPLVGLSTSWVKAGALYALDWDYTDLGIQCADMALKVLSGVEARAIPPATPRKIVYSINLKTAHDMKIELATDIVKGAREVF